MSSFTSPLKVSPLDDGDLWKVLEPFSYYTNLPCVVSLTHESVTVDTNGRSTITVRAGYLTDFATVPPLLWSVVAPTGKHAKAAVIHDWIYDNRIGPRKWCDDVFYEAMKVSGVSWWKRKLIYWSVRLRGAGYYWEVRPWESAEQVAWIKAEYKRRGIK